MADEQPDKSAEQTIDIDQSSDQLDSVSIPIMSEKKRVCVIGAGASGLVSMKVTYRVLESNLADEFQ